jgi:hypothetical protein
MRLTVEQLECRTLLSSYSAATASDLIADINAANRAGGSNTITLTAPTTSPYVLTTVDNHTDGPTGLPVIGTGKKADNLTIMGNGDTIQRSTSSGTPAFRLLDVASAGSLTLENLIVQNGLAFGSGSSAEGGAIFNQGTLVLSGVTVQGNIGAGSDGADGVEGRAGNDASGGGVWSGSSLTLENGTVLQNNQAKGGFGGSGIPAGVGGNAFGAGVYVAGGTANITGATIDNNVAVGGKGGSVDVHNHIYAQSGNASGGGVYIAAGTVTLSIDTVDGNQANGGYNVLSVGHDGGSAYGGGICLAAGTVTLSSDTVVGNSATILDGGGGALAGGGIYIGSQATATLCNDTVESNSVVVVGLIAGAAASPSDIYIDPTAVVYLDASTKANTGNIFGPYTLTPNC